MRPARQRIGQRGSAACRAVRVGARAERRTRSDDGRHDHDEPAASSVESGAREAYTPRSVRSRVGRQPGAVCVFTYHIFFLYHSKSSVVSGKTPTPPTPTATSEVNRTRPLYTLKIVDHHVDHYPLGQAGSGWRRALSSTFVKTVFDVSLKPCIRKAPRREGSVNRTCTMSNR